VQSTTLLANLSQHPSRITLFGEEWRRDFLGFTAFAELTAVNREPYVIVTGRQPSRRK
jgi:hypothetical protein